MNARTNGQGLTKKALQKRDTFIDAAVELFDERGYHLTSMDDLAAEVGAAKGTLYYYFSSKEEILYLIHDQYIERLLANSQSLQDTPVHRSATHALEIFVTELLNVMSSYERHVRVFLENHREVPEPFRSQLASKRLRYFTSLKDILDRGVQSNEFRPMDSEMLTSSILAMCSGGFRHVIQAYAEDRPRAATVTDPAAMAQSIISVIVSGIRQQ